MRQRACGLFLHDGQVLLQRKRGETIWALPGGRVEPGETPEAALAREWQEELGYTPAIGRLLWVLENSFTQDGRTVSQMEHCFAVTADADVHPQDVTLEFRWFGQATLTTVDFRPARLRKHLFAPPGPAVRLA